MCILEFLIAFVLIYVIVDFIYIYSIICIIIKEELAHVICKLFKKNRNKPINKREAIKNAIEFTYLYIYVFKMKLLYNNLFKPEIITDV